MSKDVKARDAPERQVKAGDVFLVTDTAPFVGLAAAIAWVSLVTVEFYERIYRDRIERNRELLERLGDEKLKVLAGEMVDQTRRGAPIGVDARLRDIRSVMNAQEVLARNRWITLILLIVLSMLTVGASYAPDFVLCRVTLPVTTTSGTTVYELSLTLALVDYVVLFVVFLAGYWFLNRMLWFDKQVLSVSRKLVVPACRKCGSPLSLIGSKTIGRWQCKSCGERRHSPLRLEGDEAASTNKSF